MRTREDGTFGGMLSGNGAAAGTNNNRVRHHLIQELLPPGSRRAYANNGTLAGLKM